MILLILLRCGKKAGVCFCSNTLFHRIITEGIYSIKSVFESSLFTRIVFCLYFVLLNKHCILIKSPDDLIRCFVYRLAVSAVKIANKSVFMSNAFLFICPRSYRILKRIALKLFQAYLINDILSFLICMLRLICILVICSDIHNKLCGHFIDALLRR